MAMMRTTSLAVGGSNNECTFKGLPKDAWSHVFSFLAEDIYTVERMLLVCKTWHQWLIEQQLFTVPLWERNTFLPLSWDVEVAIKTLTSKRFCKLKHLVLDGCPNISEVLSESAGAGLQLVTLSCNRYDFMNSKLISPATPTDHDANYIAKLGGNTLTGLNLNSCREIEDRGLSVIAATCTNLTVLRICGLFKLTDIAMQAIADNCTKLSALDTIDCRNITQWGLEAVRTNNKRLQAAREQQFS